MPRKIVAFEAFGQNVLLGLEHDNAGKVLDFSAIPLDLNFYTSSLSGCITTGTPEAYDCIAGCGAYWWRPQTSETRLRYYDSYDVPTKAFSGYYWERGDKDHPGVVPVCGTGITDKADRFKFGDDPYLATPTKYMEGVEFGGTVSGTATAGSTTSLTDNATATRNFIGESVQIGDIITTINPNRVEPITNFLTTSVDFAAGAAIIPGVTTYSIAISNPNRKSYTTAGLRQVHPQWLLYVDHKAPYPESNWYDAESDTDMYPTGTSVRIDGGGSTGYSRAHLGFNDEASAWCAYEPAVAPAGGVIPGWGIQAYKYGINWTFKNTRNFYGGRIYASKVGTNWFYWDSGWFNYSPSNPAHKNVAMAARVAERWISDRISSGYTVGLNFPVL